MQGPHIMNHDHHQFLWVQVMRNIIYGTLAAGCLAYLMQFLQQPLILGYLLGGVLVGPIGLRLIIDEHEIVTMILGAKCPNVGTTQGSTIFTWSRFFPED